VRLEQRAELVEARGVVEHDGVRVPDVDRDELDAADRLRLADVDLAMSDS